MSYIGLGSKKTVSAADKTGLNDGNLTNAFDVAVLGAKVPFYEIYSMSITGLARVATVTVFVGTRIRSSARLAGAAEWDPAQPILMTPTDELSLCWDLPAASPPVTVTVWMRYDPALNPPQPTG